VQKCITKSAGDWDAMGELQPEVVAAATLLLSQHSNHKTLSAALQQAPPAVRTLVRQAKQVSRRVQGSPGSFASLRSRATAAWDAHGMWTMMLNMNPSELDSAVAFEIAGHKYTFDDAGKPVDRPNQRDRWRIIASNPLAIAHFMELFITAFVDVFLHWPLGAKQQERRDTPCLYGLIDAYFFKFESAGRGGIHVHGAVVQRHLQPQVLDRLLSDPATRLLTSRLRLDPSLDGPNVADGSGEQKGAGGAECSGGPGALEPGRCPVPCARGGRTTGRRASTPASARGVRSPRG
jgi:hypothetical protein